MNIEIEKVIIRNFKGIKELSVDFSHKTTISGQNASGKTTVVDAVMHCLFGMDSLGNSKFEIRPLDKNGDKIHNLVISVCVILKIAGLEKELKREVSENWVKKRGSENPVLQGNVSSYSIDGYPKSEKEFKEYVNSIVSDDLFKMLTNPTYFSNMHWKDQRAIIMKMASKVPDVELAKKLKKFEPLLDELQKAPSTDDIKAKYQKSVNELKKKQAEIPVRIDELSNNKEEIDVAELELLKNSLKEQIAEAKGKIADADKRYEEYQKLSDGIMELKFAESDLQRKANEENNKKRRNLEEQISDKNFLVRKTEKTVDSCERQLEASKEKSVVLNESIEKYRSQYKTAQNLEFDENSLVCSYCGQEYPQDRKEQIKADFEKNKQSEIDKIIDLGKSAKLDLELEKEDISTLDAELVEHRKSLAMLNEVVADLENQLSKLPTSIDVSDTDEYKAIQKQIAEKEQALCVMNSADDVRCSLNTKLEDLQAQLIECEKQIALSEKNVEIDERILELQSELKEVGVKIASQQKYEYLLDEFIKYKLNKISGSINSMFNGVNFKLFDIQLNGGVKEVCECTVNGVPYGSLNNGHRIIAGLQIIKALQKIYGVHLPIFVDNAEAVNDFNIPDMDCQLIKLVVADNKDLTIEIG